MTPRQVINYFGGRQEDVARATGLTQSAISGWSQRGAVAEIWQWRLHHWTNGQLPLDKTLSERPRNFPVNGAEGRRLKPPPGPNKIDLSKNSLDDVERFIARRQG